MIGLCLQYRVCRIYWNFVFQGQNDLKLVLQRKSYTAETDCEEQLPRKSEYKGIPPVPLHYLVETPENLWNTIQILIKFQKGRRRL